jgi:hypothetical protein
MTPITLPLWQLLMAIGIPFLVLLTLVGVVRHRVKPRKTKNNESTGSFSKHPWMEFNEKIFQEMLSQQIDAVFNTLGAVIEAERVKLRALVLHDTTNPAAQDRRRAVVQMDIDGQDPNDQSVRNFHFNPMSEDGHKNAAMDAEKGLSRSETALVQKLRQKSKSTQTVA